MLTLVYRSDAAVLLPQSALSDLCFQSAAKNLRLGITGFLVEHEGTFLQVLEGKPPDVDRLFDRIVTDARHQNVSILSHEISQDQRIFGFWSMNFGPLNDPDFWVGEFANFQGRAAFRIKSHSADFALRVLSRAYTHACVVADADPVVGAFVRGKHPALAPKREGV
ncbi:BLUF domain-containing protein [Azospirillum doebereinerae]